MTGTGTMSPATKLDRIAQHADEARKACQAMASHLAAFVQVAQALGKRLDGLEDFNGDLVGGLETAFSVLPPRNGKSAAKEWADYWEQLARFRRDEQPPQAEPEPAPIALQADPVPADLEPVTVSEPAIRIVPISEPCGKCGVLRLKGEDCKEGCDLPGINLRSLPNWQTSEGKSCASCGMLADSETMRCYGCGIERVDGVIVAIEKKEATVEVKDKPAVTEMGWIEPPTGKAPVAPPAFAHADDVNACRARLLGAHGHEPEALLTALWEKAWQAGWQNGKEDGAPLREGTAQGAVDRALNALSPYLRVEAQLANNGDYWKARNVLAHLVSGSFESEGEPVSDWVPLVTKAVDEIKRYAAISNGLLHVEQPNVPLMIRAIVIDAFNAGARGRPKLTDENGESLLRSRQKVFAEGEAKGALDRGQECMAEIETMAKRHQTELAAQDRESFGRGWLAAAARLRQVGVQMMAHVPDAQEGADEQE